MALDSQLLEILACPDDKGALYYFEEQGALFCPKCARRYAVRDDIPIMLVDEAEVLDDAAAKALLDRAASEGLRPTFEA